MYSANSAVGNKAPCKGVSKPNCPYGDVRSMQCSASDMKLPNDQRRNMMYCSTGNFDCCPVFLAKFFRGNERRSLSLGGTCGV